MQSTQNCPSSLIAAKSTQKLPQSTQSNWIAFGLQNYKGLQDNWLDCIKIALIAGQLQQLHVSQGDQDRQSIEFAAVLVLPHRLRFHPAPSYTAPTYHSKSKPQSPIPTQSRRNHEIYLQCMNRRPAIYRTRLGQAGRASTHCDSFQNPNTIKKSQRNSWTDGRPVVEQDRGGNP